MAVTSANHVFLPWVRQGAAAGIQTEDTLNDSVAGAVSIPVKLRVNNTNDIARDVRLFGPGDVLGIDPLQVIRTEPRNLATDFEPNYFAAIEFDRPDFPWLFTPAKADGSNRLRPWLCLIVVRKQPGVTLRTDRNLLLPILEIKDPAKPKDELPDLEESWAWAHAQVTGNQPQKTVLEQTLAADPALNLSRLLSPRRLDSLTDYIACVVPAFDLGVKAGLGDQITADDEKSLKPSWTSGTQSPAQVQLPVYYSWQFHTGEGADFEALVSLLEARDPSDLPPEVGKKQIDISKPGFSINPPLPAGSILDFEGALRLAETSVDDWTPENRTLFQGELKKILEVPWLAMKDGAEPLLAPPIYGCWHVGRHILNTTASPLTALPWLDELNLDPRERSVAALGTVVIQLEQEQLMAAAWEQLGEIQRINQIRRQAQLGRAVNAVYHAKHFSRFSEETLLKVVAPAQSRLLVETVDGGSQKTRAMLSQRIAQSALPDRAVSATLRKLTSPRSAIATRFQPQGARPIAFVVGLNNFISFTIAPRFGAVIIDQVTDALVGAVAEPLKPIARFSRILTALSTAPKLGDFSIAAEGVKRSLLSFTPRAASDSPEALAFRAAASAHQNYLAQASIVPSFARLAPIDMSTTREPLLQSIKPERTIKARVQASLEISGPQEIGGDPLEPLLDAPDFPQPMYESLRDLSQDFLLPGLDKVPANTVALLETNSKFVESFLVGLNVEMNREFLWRNYPTDQRGTFFRQFWDTSASSSQSKDIKPVIEWGDQSKLGDNANAGDDLVLLIRGELLRRYPNSVIYAVAAVNVNGKFDLSPKPEDEKHPLFRGSLNPDVTFLGFDLKKEDALADPGWFFVIQEQPTEPRFGMDVADFTKPLPTLTTWNNLSWRHLAGTQAELSAITYASVKTPLGKIAPAEWGRNSAHQAFITLQRPVRIGIHAKELLVKG
jgi:hypothetical protein